MEIFHFINCAQVLTDQLSTMFSSPELNSSIELFLSLFVRRPSDCTIFTLSTSSLDPLGQFQPKWTQNIFKQRRFEVVHKIQGCVPFQCEIIAALNQHVCVIISVSSSCLFIAWKCFSAKRYDPRTY